MRLIDADALLEKVQFRLPGKSQYAEVIARCVEITRQLIVDSPTIDAVPVVRCRDCVNGELCLNAQGAEYVVCSMDEHHVWLPNGFCSYGERRDGDG